MRKTQRAGVDVLLASTSEKRLFMCRDGAKRCSVGKRYDTSHITIRVVVGLDRQLEFCEVLKAVSCFVMADQAAL